MKPKTRQAVYQKYGGRCAYCGKRIGYKDMQVDHIYPARFGGLNHIDNYNPACRRCNHYKRATTLERFRELLLTLHKRVKERYLCKVAEDYGIIEYHEWNGRFYFEQLTDQT